MNLTDVRRGRERADGHARGRAVAVAVATSSAAAAPAAAPVAREEVPADVLHLVHWTGCTQQGADWLRTWCDIAVEPSGQRTSSGAGQRKPVCADCAAAPGCPVCGAAADELT
ncbi:hypothetical protein ACDF64_12720 [Agromyces sp. MMS24-JH15]|uniref:hypothetical protein n=1 Tax=Agromyces sp. MMS24-JH15 TaxID=3243765 RepID=UPI00374A6D94